MKQYKLYLRVWAEYGSSGIWWIENPKQMVPVKMMKFEMLNLPQNLITEFQSWNDEFDENLPFPPEGWDWKKFDNQGHLLAQKLKVYLGSDYYVEREIDGKYQEII